jgi:hypothetical protein
MIPRLASLSLLALLAAASAPAGSGSAVPTATSAAQLKAVARAATARGFTLPIRRPARVTRGDLLIAGIAVRVGSARSIRPPAGWRAVRSDGRRKRAALSQIVYYKLATAVEPPVYRWHYAQRRAASGGLLVYSGLDGGRPLGGHSGRVRSATRLVVAPSLRPNARDALVVAFFSATGRGRLAAVRGLKKRIAILGAARVGVTTQAGDATLATGTTGTKAARSTVRHRTAIGQLVAFRTSSAPPPGAQPQPPPPPPPPPPPGPGGPSLPAPLPPSTGQTFYVATNGSDSNPGTLALPWRTVQKALATLTAGQRALVRGGTYGESLDMARAGTATAPITVENYPGERPIVNGGGQRPLEILSSGAYVRIRGFVFENSPYDSGGNVDIYGHHVEFSANEVRNAQDQGIYSDEDSHHAQLLGNWIHHNGEGVFHQSHGIYLQGNDHLVANNVIHDHPKGFGIQVYDRNSRSIITANTVTGAGHSGIVVGGSGGVDNIRVVNNVFAFNAHYGISHDSTCPTASRADHNVVFGNSWGPTHAGCSGLDYSRGNRTTDPLFVNYAGRNLRVNAGSPAIGYALPEFSPGSDFDGNARPQSAPDAGAFER